MTQEELTAIGAGFRDIKEALRLHRDAHEQTLDHERRALLDARMTELSQLIDNMSPQMVELQWDEAERPEWVYPELVRRAAVQLNSDLRKLKNTAFVLELAGGAVEMGAALFASQEEPLQEALIRMGMQPIGGVIPRA